MSLIRNSLGAIMALGMLSVLGGCQTEQRIPASEQLSSAPNHAAVASDPAMTERDWKPMWALYANDAVLAWPDYAPLRGSAEGVEVSTLAEPIWFLSNTAYTPVGMVRNPPWQMLEYKSITTPPSYSDMPPQVPFNEDTLSKENAHF